MVVPLPLKLKRYHQTSYALISFASAGVPQSFFSSCSYQVYSWSTSDTNYNLSYVCSRIFLTNPPGEDNALVLHPAAPDALKERERILAEEEPEANVWVCLAVIAVTIGLLAVTAEFLVDTLDHVREEGSIGEEYV